MEVSSKAVILINICFAVALGSILMSRFGLF
ncbi:stress response membrane protein YncL [Pluralibacter gergoviae]